MGGTPAPGDPLRRTAGHRQDLHGQGDGARSRRAVPLRLGERVPVDVLRADEPQDPLLLQSLRKIARREGGAIGFIEEIDAIAGSRGGVSRATATDGDGGRGVSRSDAREGISGVVNELLVQMQSFDEPTIGGRIRGWGIDRVNRFLPAGHQIQKQPPIGSNILVIGATNRAADLDPALLRPGRFDRSIYFGLPGRGGRREIIDYYLNKKAHVPELDKDERRDTARGDDVRVLAGDDRAPLRRSARVVPARRARGDGVGRRPAGEAHRGDRARAAGRVHGRGEVHSSRPTRRATRWSRTSSASAASSRC